MTAEANDNQNIEQSKEAIYAILSRTMEPTMPQDHCLNLSYTCKAPELGLKVTVFWHFIWWQFPFTLPCSNQQLCDFAHIVAWWQDQRSAVLLLSLNLKKLPLANIRSNKLLKWSSWAENWQTISCKNYWCWRQDKLDDSSQWYCERYICVYTFDF